MSESTQLQEVVPGEIWGQERALWFNGVRLRSRSTVVRLADGKLWVHSPAAPTAEVCAELDALGEVAWIVVPNRFHYLHAAAMKEKYPEAQLLGPKSVESKAELRLDRATVPSELRELLPEIEAHSLVGVPLLDETLFFHRKTETLIGADVMMCGCPRDHWTWRWVSRVCGQYERYKVPPDVRWHTHASSELRQCIEQLAQLPLERICVAHSEPIVDLPAEQLKEAWRFAFA